MKLKRKLLIINIIIIKYITTAEFNKYSEESFDLRLKQANLTGKSDITNLRNQTNFDNKIKYVT